MKCKYVHRMFTNVHKHRNPKNTETITTFFFFFGSGTKPLFTFLSWRFFDHEERETTIPFYADFSIRPPLQTNWSGLGELRKLTCFVQAQISTLFFFSNSQILSPSLRAWRHSRTRFFLLWHLWLSHPPRARVNSCTQCVHLTNPCTKPKVFSLTKQKDKIYKTKIDNVNKILPQYITFITVICLPI